MDRLRVLVVDDEPRIRQVVTAALAVDGWSVSEAGDGEDALRQLDAFKPDVMLLDLRMPRLDGSGLLRRLAGRADAPIVVATSAYADHEDVVEIMKLGAVEFLPKPFDPATLRSVLRDALTREPAGIATTCDDHLNAMKRHARLRRFDDAERDVRAALAMDDRCAHAFYFLGMLLELKNAPREARMAYEQCLAIDSRLVAARKRIAKIDRGAAATSNVVEQRT